jgi:hypothetical protein
MEARFSTVAKQQNQQFRHTAARIRNKDEKKWNKKTGVLQLLCEKGIANVTEASPLVQSLLLESSQDRRTHSIDCAIDEEVISCDSFAEKRSHCFSFPTSHRR